MFPTSYVMILFEEICIDWYMSLHMSGCQIYGPFLGTLNNRCRIIIGTQKGTLTLTTTHIYIYIYIHEQI